VATSRSTASEQEPIMQYFIQSIRRPAAAYPVRRALAGILAAFVGPPAATDSPTLSPPVRRSPIARYRTPLSWVPRSPYFRR
jgi:hypothetical protein